MLLAEKFQITEAERTLRKEYGRISAADAAELRALLPSVEREVDGIVHAFYEHLLRFAAAREFVRDHNVLDRVMRAQREYVLDLFRGNYDDSYFERRLQIGVVHERIGLPGKWYIASNSMLLQLLMPILVRRYWFRPFRLVRAALALYKVLNLDEQLVMDTYIGSMVEKLRGISVHVMRTVEMLAPTARESAEAAEATAVTAGRALEIARRGAITVQKALEGMNSLKEKANDAVHQIQRLDRQLKNVEDIVILVGNLTTQTNMLALNAEVQAARAGERGKGFAVVAEEIRKLADQSAESLTRVHGLVAEIRDASHQTVLVSEANTQTVESGTELTREIGEAFNRLALSYEEAFGNVQQISTTAQDQAKLLLELQREVESRGGLGAGAGDGRQS